eukprot:3839174-Amphidinium_carterae.1
MVQVLLGHRPGGLGVLDTDPCLRVGRSPRRSPEPDHCVSAAVAIYGCVSLAIMDFCLASVT